MKKIGELHEHTEAKTLFIDIETAPLVCYVWQKSIYNTNIATDQIISDTHLLSFAAKWIDSDKIIYHDQRGVNPKSNDKKLLKLIAGLLDEADIVIAHNGKAFDIKFINSRFVSESIPPPRPYRQIDTFLQAKHAFGFTKNSLEFLLKALKCKNQKSKHPKYVGIDMWIEVLADNRSAWEEMKKYNILDVYGLEELYYKIRPYMEGHPNVGVFLDDDNPVCPKCGGKVQRRGFKAVNVNIYQQYQCMKCGGWSRSRKSVNSAEHKNKQLVN